MRAVLRGFLAGFGFALGASVAGTLIGYTIGRIGEASVKRLLSPEPTSSPAPSSSQPSSEQPDSDEPPGMFGKTVEEWRALKGTCRRCGSREILQHPDGEYCGKCGYGMKGDRASISVVHDGLTPEETIERGEEQHNAAYGASLLGAEGGVKLCLNDEPHKRHLWIQGSIQFECGGIAKPHNAGYGAMSWKEYAAATNTLCEHGFIADGQACGEFGCTEPALQQHSPDYVSVMVPGAEEADVTYVVDPAEIPTMGFLKAVKENITPTGGWPDGEPGDDEDDGSDYHKALDRHDNAGS